MKTVGSKLIVGILIAAGITVAGFAFAAGSSICTGTTCQTSEVGPFMQEISKACGNEGTCSLADITQVFNNVGNWILGIIGALVFLMYIVGGFYFLLSGVPGMEKFREKGKTAIKTSTVGLIIVFFSYAGLHTLKLAVTSGNITDPTETTYVTCGPGEINSKLPCGFNMVCGKAENLGICVTECDDMHPAPSSEEIADDTAEMWDCVDKDTLGVSGCEANYCPGAVDVQCCKIF